MSNIFSQSLSPAFTKESVDEFFVDPMFMGSDVRGDVTVRTGIKGTEKLNKISRPGYVTKPKTSAGFTPAGALALTQDSITVQPMAIEFEQNAREFWGSVLEMLLASGYKEDDVEKMSQPDVWNKVILPIIAQAGQADLIRQMWFADSDNSSDDWNGYDGFFTNFYNALQDASNRMEHFTIGDIGEPHDSDCLLEATVTAGDTLEITINGTEYAVTGTTTDGDDTGDLWVSTHAAAVLANYDLVATHNSTTHKLNLTTTVRKLITVTAAGDALDALTINEAGEDASLSADEIDEACNQMLTDMPNVMLELNPVFRMGRKAYRNLLTTWKNLGTETANFIQFKGLSTPHYEGVPILVHPEWDVYSRLHDDLNYFPIVLAPQPNLVFATDGTSDSEMIESWYNNEEQMRRYRVQYKAQTTFLHSELLSLAGLIRA